MVSGIVWQSLMLRNLEFALLSQFLNFARGIRLLICSVRLMPQLRNNILVFFILYIIIIFIAKTSLIKQNEPQSEPLLKNRENRQANWKTVFFTIKLEFHCDMALFHVLLITDTSILPSVVVGAGEGDTSVSGSLTDLFFNNLTLMSSMRLFLPGVNTCTQMIN